MGDVAGVRRKCGGHGGGGRFRMEVSRKTDSEGEGGFTCGGGGGGGGGCRGCRAGRDAGRGGGGPWAKGGPAAGGAVIRHGSNAGQASTGQTLVKRRGAARGWADSLGETAGVKRWSKTGQGPAKGSGRGQGRVWAGVDVRKEGRGGGRGSKAGSEISALGKGTMVKSSFEHRSNAGQRLVKRWPDAGQTLAKLGTWASAITRAGRVETDAVALYWSKSSQLLVKCW
jgi:hypothetical protein